MADWVDDGGLKFGGGGWGDEVREEEKCCVRKTFVAISLYLRIILKQKLKN